VPEIATWDEGEFPYRIDYDRKVFESIRETAVQRLMDLPKVGLGVGGLLLGKREAHGLTVLGLVEIPCSHAFGPSFTLTTEEHAHARELIAGVGDRGVGDPGVIGWYVSKGVRPLELTDADRKQLAILFPHQWQLGVMIQPHIVRPARVAFFFQDAAGQARKVDGGELAPWESDVEESTVAAAAAGQGTTVAVAPPTSTTSPTTATSPTVALASAPPASKRHLIRMPEQLRDDWRLFASVTTGAGTDEHSRWTVLGLTVAVMLLFISAFSALFMRN